MKSSRWRPWVRAILIVSIAAIGASRLGREVPRAEGGAGPSAETAKAIVSQSTGVSVDRLTVARTAPLADTGIRRYKLVDAQGRIHGVDLDPSGNPLSREALERVVREVGQRGFVGKLERELADFLARQDDTRPVNVIFWLRGTTVEPLAGDGVRPEQYEANLRTMRAQIAAIQKPLADQLRAHGMRVIYQTQYAPLVVAAVTPPVIRTMAARPDVERIFIARVKRPSLDVSRVVVQANVVNGRGIEGAGIRVGIVEPGKIGPHPNLPQSKRILCRPEVGAAVSEHKTLVTGVIQSTHAIVRGVAPFITIVDGIAANFWDDELIAATECVIGRGAAAINMSFEGPAFPSGGPDLVALWVDATVYRTGRTIVAAAGNDCNGGVGSPAVAFNAIAVGSFSDRNTVGFADDVHSCHPALPAGEQTSRYIDPVSAHGDREEPDLVAPGHLITTTSTVDPGFDTQSGTSLAAPHVAGGAGLVVDRRYALRDLAAEVRAILMASARHNIEGDSRLSEIDGVGAIMLAAADRVRLDHQSSSIIRTGGAVGFPIPRSFEAAAGQRVRVVTAWLDKGGYLLQQPSTDLDLVVFDPTGVLIGLSSSYDNNFEIVEFTAPVTGVYTAEIQNSRDSLGKEFVGFAVSRSDL